MERKRFELLPCRRRGVEAVQADTALVFGRHTHEQFGIGLLERGAQRSASGRGVVEAGAGDIITVNPGEVHDGAPIGEGGRAWRMLYLDPAIVAELSIDLADGGAAPPREFSRPVVSDQRMAGLFSQLFHAMTDGAGDTAQLKADESLILLLARLLRARSAEPRSVPAGIASARSLIDDDPAAVLTLTDLAREAGLSRYQFLRGFSLATGLTPHAYLLQRRIHLARQLIGGGARPIDAAARCGFADQSHMTRLFVRSFGIAPGAYAKAAAA